MGVTRGLVWISFNKTTYLRPNCNKNNLTFFFRKKNDPLLTARVTCPDVLLIWTISASTGKITDSELDFKLALKISKCSCFRFKGAPTWLTGCQIDKTRSAWAKNSSKAPWPTSVSIDSISTWDLSVESLRDKTPFSWWID